MRGEWQLKAVRGPGARRSCLRRPDGSDRFSGTTSEVFSFISRAQKHLCSRAVFRVEAWSTEQMEFDFLPELSPLVFVIRPHVNGRDWVADENERHHGGWFRSLQSAINYAFFRGSGKLSAVHVLAADGTLQRVILADQRGYDTTPTVAPSISSSRQEGGDKDDA